MIDFFRQLLLSIIVVITSFFNSGADVEVLETPTPIPGFTARPTPEFKCCLTPTLTPQVIIKTVYVTPKPTPIILSANPTPLPTVFPTPQIIYVPTPIYLTPEPTPIPTPTPILTPTPIPTPIPTPEPAIITVKEYLGYDPLTDMIAEHFYLVGNVIDSLTLGFYTQSKELVDVSTLNCNESIDVRVGSYKGLYSPVRITSNPMTVNLDNALESTNRVFITMSGCAIDYTTAPLIKILSAKGAVINYQ